MGGVPTPLRFEGAIKGKREMIEKEKRKRGEQEKKLKALFL